MREAYLNDGRVEDTTTHDLEHTDVLNIEPLRVGRSDLAASLCERMPQCDGQKICEHKSHSRRPQ
jgi:hypothetical protein